MPYTVVSFHAHPDDEVLLSGGTLARAAAEGHRVVLVTATAGEAGLSSASMQASGGLGRRRLGELEAAAAALGCHDVRMLGYDDSGMDGRAGRDGFAFSRVEVERAADRLAEVLVETSADVLTVYDAAGGYGHPDHVQVHRVGLRAAALAGTPVVLEATVDREALLRLTGTLRRLGIARWAPPEWHPERLAHAYTARGELTHRVDVRGHLAAKRAAMAAHASQRVGGAGSRSLALMLRLPSPIYRRVFGHEWFRELGRTPTTLPLDDIFASVVRYGE